MWCGRVYKLKILKMYGLMHRPAHYAGGIRKRITRFHSENASNAFRPHYTWGSWKPNNHRSFLIHVCEKLGQGAPFSTCPVSTRNEKPAFSNSSGLKSAGSKSFDFVTHKCGGNPNHWNKTAFQISSDVILVCMLPINQLVLQFLLCSKISLARKCRITGSTQSCWVGRE